MSVTSDWRVTGTSKPSQVEYNITAPKVDKYIVEDQIGEFYLKCLRIYAKIVDLSMEQKLWKTLEHIFANAIIYDITSEGELCG